MSAIPGSVDKRSAVVRSAQVAFPVLVRVHSITKEEARGLARRVPQERWHCNPKGDALTNLIWSATQAALVSALPEHLELDEREAVAATAESVILALHWLPPGVITNEEYEALTNAWRDVVGPVPVIPEWTGL